MANQKVHTSFLLAVIILGLFFSSSLSAKNCRDADSIGKHIKEYPVSKEDFLNKYGKDDSSKALIELFFKKQQKGKKETIWWTAIGIIGVLLLIAFANSSQNYGIGAILIIIYLGIVPFAAIAGLATGIYKWIRFSKKRLEKLLKDYNSGKGIPKKIRRKKAFLTQLKLLENSNIAK